MIIILLLSSGICLSQDSEYLKLWNKYHDECSVIVSDTLTEKGTVTYDINPVGGDLKLIPIDTTWNTQKCAEYKEYGNNGSIILGYNNWDNVTLTANNLLYYSSDTIGYSYIERSEREKFTTTITRKKICKLKLRRPTQDGFWSWLKENGHRK